MSIDQEKIRRLLVKKRQELEQDSEHSSQNRKAVKLDQQSVGRVSRIDALQRQAMAKAGEQRRLAEIGRIDAALKRLDTDEFGACLKCGEDIAEKRLEANPSVTLCISCAK